MAKKKQKQEPVQNSNQPIPVKEEVLLKPIPKKGLVLLALFCALSLGFVYFHHQRSSQLSLLDLPPLNKSLPEEFFSKIHMKGSLLEILRSFEHYYILKDYTKALHYAWMMVDKYGYHCHPCVAFVLDVGIKLGKKSDTEIINLCQKASQAMGPIPRMIAACSYYDDTYRQKLIELGLDIQDPWKYAYSTP